MDIILEVIGWVGSLLIVWSLMQARVLRFRWMNLTGAVVATAYNAIIEIWPFAFMNLAITVINIYWLTRLYRESHDEAVYKVLAVRPDDVFVRQFLEEHRTDVHGHAPGFDLGADPAGDDGRHLFLVVRGDEGVGVVSVRDLGDGVGEVELDWVKKRFRDFTPGEFVYRESEVLAEAGFRRLELVPHDGTDLEYLRRVGFHESDDRWAREVASA